MNKFRNIKHMFDSRAWYQEAVSQSSVTVWRAIFCCQKPEYLFSQCLLIHLSINVPQIILCLEMNFHVSWAIDTICEILFATCIFIFAFLFTYLTLCMNYLIHYIYIPASIYTYTLWQWSLSVCYAKNSKSNLQVSRRSYSVSYYFLTIVGCFFLVCW